MTANSNIPGARSAPAGTMRIAVWFLPLLLGGCATAVIAPVDPARPVSVYLLDHGRHTSLVLPSATGGLVRYAYGDWTWYAQSQPGFVAGLRALFCPSRAALGRWELAGGRSVSELRASLGVGVEHIHVIEVDRRAVARLRAALDEIYRSARERLSNPQMQLDFVEHPDPYTAFHNSNRVVASWLEALDCEIEGSALFARWHLEAPDARDSPAEGRPDGG